MPERHQRSPEEQEVVHISAELVRVHPEEELTTFPPETFAQYVARLKEALNVDAQFRFRSPQWSHIASRLLMMEDGSDPILLSGLKTYGYKPAERLLAKNHQGQVQSLWRARYTPDGSALEAVRLPHYHFIVRTLNELTSEGNCLRVDYRYDADGRVAHELLTPNSSPTKYDGQVAAVISFRYEAPVSTKARGFSPFGTRALDQDLRDGHSWRRHGYLYSVATSNVTHVFEEIVDRPTLDGDDIDPTSIHPWNDRAMQHGAATRRFWNY